MKRVSRDRTHIDYTAGNVGVRVWQTLAEAIVRQRSGVWRKAAASVGVQVCIPADLAQLPVSNGRVEAADATGILDGVVSESPHREELLLLIHGSTSFEDALSAALERKRSE